MHDSADLEFPVRPHTRATSLDPQFWPSCTGNVIRAHSWASKETRPCPARHPTDPNNMHLAAQPRQVAPSLIIMGTGQLISCNQHCHASAAGRCAHSPAAYGKFSAIRVPSRTKQGQHLARGPTCYWPSYQMHSPARVQILEQPATSPGCRPDTQPQAQAQPPQTAPKQHQHAVRGPEQHTCAQGGHGCAVGHAAAGPTAQKLHGSCPDHSSVLPLSLHIHTHPQN